MLKNKKGFTIVELLIVIVIIGILAAISIVSYVGISNRAIIASLQSDLSNASKQLELFRAVNGVYPTSIDCTIADSTTNKCIKSNSATFSYSVNNSTNPPTYNLGAINGTVAYSVTESTPAVPATPTWKYVIAGSFLSCGISSSDKAYCWGQNANGAVGDGTVGNNRLVPTSVNTSGVLNGLTIKSIASGYGHTCAIASDNKVYCWGLNTYGQIGDNSSGTDRLLPVAVNASGVLNGLTIKSIAVGMTHSCVIASDNKPYCWGGNAEGEIGDGTSGTNRLSPTAVNMSGALNGLTVKSITVGDYHTCVIASDNKPYCWGKNDSGQIGDNSSGTNRLAPTVVYASGALAGLTVKTISSGWYGNCVIASNDRVYCWGSNNYGQVGDNTSGTNRLVPTAVYTSGVLNGLNIKTVSAGARLVCVTDLNDKAYCWGQNGSGSVGDGTSGANVLIPTAVSTSGNLNGLTIKTVSAGWNNACAIASNDRAYCWGYNNSGALGDGTVISKVLPTPVSLPQ